MVRNQKTSILSETKRDFRIAWQSLKDNFKAFLATELFAALAFILTIFILGSILIIVVSLIPSVSLSDFAGQLSDNFGISHIFRFLTGLIAFSLFNAFLNCQHGLAYDIMSSGEMFAEFKNAFTYFKRFWWQYPLLTFVLLIYNSLFSTGPRIEGSGPNFLDITFDFIQILIIIGKLILFFIWFIIFIHTFPSLTSQGNFKRSFIESFRIIKSNPKRIISTWGFYFLIFIVPIILLGILVGVYEYTVLYVICGIIFILITLIGIPMLSLIACGIYNNVEFQRFKPYSEKQKERI